MSESEQGCGCALSIVIIIIGIIICLAAHSWFLFSVLFFFVIPCAIVVMFTDDN